MFAWPLLEVGFISPLGSPLSTAIRTVSTLSSYRRSTGRQNPESCGRYAVRGEYVTERGPTCRYSLARVHIPRPVSLGDAAVDELEAVHYKKPIVIIAKVVAYDVWTRKPEPPCAAPVRTESVTRDWVTSGQRLFATRVYTWQNVAPKFSHLRWSLSSGRRRRRQSTTRDDDTLATTVPRKTLGRFHLRNSTADDATPRTCSGKDVKERSGGAHPSVQRKLAWPGGRNVKRAP